MDKGTMSAQIGSLSEQSDRQIRAHNGGLLKIDTQNLKDNTVGSQQCSIIWGMLLGDGFLERNGRYVRLISDHSVRQEQYVRWQAASLSSLSPTVRLICRRDSRTNRDYHHCILRTTTSATLEPYYNLFYREGRKRVPATLSKMIDAQMLAVWIMDDGYRRNDCAALRLSTQSFSLEEQKLIRQALAVLGIDSAIHKQKEHFVTYIPARSMNRLRRLVAPYMLDGLRYKIA